MNCLRIHEWGGELVLDDIERPTPGATNVVASVRATDLGRTIVNVSHDDITDDSAYLPRIPGLEIVGTVVECGDGGTNMTEGD